MMKKQEELEKMTDQERDELCKRLDQELDDYLDQLEKKPYTEGWPEDRWEEEMAKHPFFMKEIPKDLDPDKMDPLLAGLQQLKYGEDDNTPEELAKNYKDDGNFNYKHKKYKLAFLCYSKGLTMKCQDSTINCQLYSNRALAQFQLQNYRSALKDAQEALKIDPKFLKALHTAAKSCLNLKDYNKCLEYCNTVLDMRPDDQEIISVQSQAIQEQKQFKRDERLRIKRDTKSKAQREQIIKALQKSNIQFDEETLFVDASYNVYLDENGCFVWPVVFTYPENRQSDFVERINETSAMYDQLKILFKEPPAWDHNNRYKLETVNVFYANHKTRYFEKVDVHKTFKEILQEPGFYISNGTPLFFITVKDSDIERTFLNNISNDSDSD